MISYLQQLCVHAMYTSPILMQNAVPGLLYRIQSWLWRAESCIEAHWHDAYDASTHHLRGSHSCCIAQYNLGDKICRTCTNCRNGADDARTGTIYTVQPTSPLSSTALINTTYLSLMFSHGQRPVLNPCLLEQQGTDTRCSALTSAPASQVYRSFSIKHGHASYLITLQHEQLCCPANTWMKEAFKYISKYLIAERCMSCMLSMLLPLHLVAMCMTLDCKLFCHALEHADRLP